MSTKTAVAWNVQTRNHQKVKAFRKSSRARSSSEGRFKTDLGFFISARVDRFLPFTTPFKPLLSQDGLSGFYSMGIAFIVGLE